MEKLSYQCEDVEKEEKGMRSEKEIIEALAPILVPILAPIIRPIIEAALRDGAAELAKSNTPAPIGTDLPETGFVRLPKVISLLGISKTTLWRRVKNKAFPAPIPLGPNIVGWRVEEVRRAIAEAGKNTREKSTSETPITATPKG